MSTTDQEQRAADTKQAHELSVLVREYIDGHHHRIQATALLSAYIQTAIANPCCTGSCLQQLAMAASMLSTHLASNQAQGNTVH